MVFHLFYISFSATLSRTSFDTVRNDLDLQVYDKLGPGSSYSRHRRECSKRRGVEPRGGRGREDRRLERNSSHRFHASPRFMKRDNRNTGWDTLWIRWNRIVSSPWTKLSSSTVEAASIYIHTHTHLRVLDDFLFDDSLFGRPGGTSPRKNKSLFLLAGGLLKIFADDACLSSSSPQGRRLLVG